MTAAGAFIPKVFEEHLEAVGLLWSRRSRAVRSPDYIFADLVDLDETIAAHLEGLGAAGEDSIPILDAELVGDDPLRAFAAAYALLTVGSPDAQIRVCDAFSKAKKGKLDALREAIAYGPATALGAELLSLFRSAPSDVGAAAAEALAIRGAITPRVEWVERFIRGEEPAARASGWRIAAYCGLAVPEDWYAAGLHDDDAETRRAAFTAATWTRSPAFYRYARSLAAAPAPEAVEPLATLAAVAPPEEYQLIGAVAANPAAGPDRFRIVGSFGHPYFVDLLIKEMENADAAAAAGAGAAFEKMTGWISQSVPRSQPVPADAQPATEGGAVHPEAAFVPDPTSARRHWAELAPRLAYSPRIARGFDVSQNVDRETFDALDMESRREYCLRMRLFSGWQGTPLVLERYPQRF